VSTQGLVLYILYGEKELHLDEVERIRMREEEYCMRMRSIFTVSETKCREDHLFPPVQLEEGLKGAVIGLDGGLPVLHSHNGAQNTCPGGGGEGVAHSPLLMNENERKSAS